MISTRGFMRWAMAIGLAAPAAAQPAGPAAQIVAYDKAINAIETAGASPATRIERFTAVVTRYYDMPAIAALVAGPAWDRATADEKASAIAALTRHSARALAKNFRGPGATRFTVDPQPIDRAGSKIVKVGAGDDTLYYRMRGNRIVDVIAGGVSQLALQRADIAATVATGGVAAMVRTLDRLDAH